MCTNKSTFTNKIEHIWVTSKKMVQSDFLCMNHYNLESIIDMEENITVWYA